MRTYVEPCRPARFVARIKRCIREQKRDFSHGIIYLRPDVGNGSSSALPVADLPVADYTRMQEADDDSSASPACVKVSSSDQPDVLSSWAFGALSFSIRDSLTFPQLFETHPFHVFIVEKQVLVCAGVDKSEAPVRQFFDRSFSHLVELP